MIMKTKKVYKIIIKLVAIVIIQMIKMNNIVFVEINL